MKGGICMKEEIAEQVVKKIKPWAEAIEWKIKDAELFEKTVLEEQFKNEEIKQWLNGLFGVDVVTIGDLYEIYLSAKITLEDEYVSAIPFQSTKGVFKKIYMPYEKFEIYMFTRYQDLSEKKKEILRKVLGDNINNARLLWKAMNELEKEV
jgi:hypothetical protein